MVWVFDLYVSLCGCEVKQPDAGLRKGEGDQDVYPSVAYLKSKYDLIQKEVVATLASIDDACD